MATIRDGNGGTDQAHVTPSKELLVTGSVTVAAITGEIEVKNDAGNPVGVVDAPLAVLVGAVTETAPASDTASSGLNGRLQRIAQRLTTLIGLLPGSLGQKTKANSLAVTLASDTDALAVTAAALPLPAGAATEATLATRLSESDFDSKTGAITETAPVSDTASSGLNGRLQRIAQRLTSLVGLLPASLGQKTKAASLAVTLASDSDALPITAAGLPLPAGAATAAKQPALGTAGVASTDVITVQGIASGTAQPVSAAALPLPAGAATEATLAARLSESDFDTKIGSLTETAPTTDTNSSGLNGRLQRIAQRLTSLIALLPASLGQKTKAASLAVTLASDSDPVVLGAGAAAIGSVTLGTGANTIGKADQGAAGAAAWPVNPQVGGSNVSNGNPLPISDAGGSVTVDTPQLPAALVGGRLPVDGSGVTQPVSAASLPLPTGASTEATLSAQSAKLPATLGQKAMANSLAVAVASDQSTLPTQKARGATASTPAQVAASVTSVQLLASNAAAIRRSIVNDSASATLYVKEGVTAATTSYSYKLAPGDTAIIDDYTGRLDGIWSAAVGVAAIAEV